MVGGKGEAAEDVVQTPALLPVQARDQIAADQFAQPSDGISLVPQGLHCPDPKITWRERQCLPACYLLQ